MLSTNECTNDTHTHARLHTWQHREATGRHLCHWPRGCRIPGTADPQSHHSSLSTGQSTHCCSARCPAGPQPHETQCGTVPEHEHAPTTVWSTPPSAARGHSEPGPGCSYQEGHGPGPLQDQCRNYRQRGGMSDSIVYFMESHKQNILYLGLTYFKYPVVCDLLPEIDFFWLQLPLSPLCYFVSGVEGSL